MDILINVLSFLIGCFAGYKFTIFIIIKLKQDKEIIIKDAKNE